MTRPAIAIMLVAILFFGTLIGIFYVQKTLAEIEEALPITLSKQERDIRVLVNDMGRLVQSIAFTRSNQGLIGFESVIRQTQEVEQGLKRIREIYHFSDLLGISAIHAKLNPAIFDIKTWLMAGVYNFQPNSPQTLELVNTRAQQAYEEAEILLLQVGETTIDVLTEQAQRIKEFRTIMILTLVVLAMMTIGMLVLGIRLQRMVQALKESEEHIRYRANYDSLTGLPNRPNFVEHLSEAIFRGQRNPGLTALLYIDLDRFKTINDTLGHDYGDELIKQVASRIHQTIRETDLVARLGGDEFTVLLTNMNDAIRASIIAKAILGRLSEPYSVYGHEIYSSASIGITVCPNDGEDANTLLKNADMAMYAAKDQGRNTFRFFTSQMTDRAQRFLELDKDMRRALREEEFYLCFQPILDLQNQSIIGIEALLRWQHPVKGLIGPDEFIPVAEETGLIVDIGLWVLRRSCAEAISWPLQDMHPEFYLSVNISMRQFKGGFGKAVLSEILAETDYPAKHLVLEITESLLIDDDARTREALDDFRQMGVGLAVDDFGTGYSALSYLRKFPVNILKIDRSFIHDIAENMGDRRLVEAIIAMAHGLDLVVVAEGVETSEQESLLRDLRCDMVQGYFYSKPIEANEIKQLIKRSI
ncbi:MAG: EAL domain-containing protein [Proteobacteria bacterium]|nr:EAL domain-containing protein [Pseudomonadota bacterium]